MPIIGCDIGKQLCEALGLDIKGVRTIDIHVTAREAVTVKVERFVDRDEARRAITVLEEYNLRPKTIDVTGLDSEVADSVPAVEEVKPIKFMEFT